MAMTRSLLWQLCAALGLAVLALFWSNQWHWPDSPSYLWQTPDQAGAEAFAHGDYLLARRHFRRPEWQALACYRAADYPCAISVAATLTSAESAFLMGNAYARMHDPHRAEHAFVRAVALRPDWLEAQRNRDLMRQAIEQHDKDNADKGTINGEPNEAPDGTVVDDRAKQGKRGEVHIEKLDANAIDKLWLRHVRTDPTEFLRLRFAREIQQREHGGAK